jgi:hypothetical protein
MQRIERAVQEQVQGMACVSRLLFSSLGTKHLVVRRDLQLSFRNRHCASKHFLSMTRLLAFAQIEGGPGIVQMPKPDT